MDAAVAFPVFVVTHVQRRFHLRIAEWLSSAMVASLGLELILAPKLFAVPFFIGFKALAAEPVWAGLALLIGGARLLALVINGHWRFSPHLRAALALLSAAGWAAIVAGIWGSHLTTLGAVIYPWMVAADLYGSGRAAVDARLADDTARTTTAH